MLYSIYVNLILLCLLFFVGFTKCEAIDTLIRLIKPSVTAFLSHAFFSNFIRLDCVLPDLTVSFLHCCTEIDYISLGVQRALPGITEFDILNDVALDFVGKSSFGRILDMLHGSNLHC